MQPDPCKDVQLRRAEPGGVVEASDATSSWDGRRRGDPQLSYQAHEFPSIAREDSGFVLRVEPQRNDFVHRMSQPCR
jgi:hypothetical protein